MNPPAVVPGNSPFAALRRMARPQTANEQCDFCNEALPPIHRHLLEIANRKIICACSGCALRFEGVIGRYKLIPRDTRSLPNFRMTNAQWEALSLPIQLAFFFQSTPAGKMVALYPSPAGATESLLPISSWEAIAVDNPELGEMQSDVEALLVNRLNGAREYYLAPIDVCFELTGLIRLHWRGFSGGEKVWEELGKYFGRLRAEAGGGEAKDIA